MLRKMTLWTSNMNNPKKISSLHYLTQDGVVGYSHVDLVKIACDAGVDWVQLRVKNTTEHAWRKIAEEVKKITDSYIATLIINDNVSIAKEIDADGVHLGKTDMSPMEARAILGENKIIGGTANDAIDIEKLMQSNVDYIGLGPFRFTQTKVNLSPVLGIEKIKGLLDIQQEIPVILIGGILSSDIAAIKSIGAYGIAVSSAINLAEDKREAVKTFLQISGKSKSPFEGGAGRRGMTTKTIN